MKDGWLWLSILNTTASPSPISTTPAFSPGPQITRGPSVGSVFSQTFDDLYEQCSLHIAEKMPSSVRFGVRPRIATARSNSSRLRPISAASSGVTLLPPIMRRTHNPERGAEGSLQGADEAGEQALAVGAAEERVGGVFRVRHQPQDGAGLVEDAGDRASRSVDVVRVGQFAGGAAITEGDPTLAFEPVERLGVSGVVAVVMRGRHPDRLAGGIAAGEDRLVVLDPQVHVAADEGQGAVGQQRARQEAGL